MTSVHFVVPDWIDDPARPCGGNSYDRHVADGLTSLGWSVQEQPVADLAALDRTVRQIPDDAVVLLDGLVASPLEAAAIRRIVKPETILVTPGVRSAGAAKGDQKRVATPAEAIRDGANYLVIGRQITRATDPAAEASRVFSEIASR